MPRYDTVLLDADNTLFDFDAAEHAALRRALEERGYPFTPETEALYLDINRPLWAAFDRMETVEQTAKIYAAVQQLGGGVELTREQTERLLALSGRYEHLAGRRESGKEG